MLERSLTVLLTVAIATHVYGASIGQKPTLLDTVNVIVDGIRAQQAADDTGSTTAAPVPGKMNVCEDLCPKWCQIIKGLQINYTNCHYMCGNLCNSKTRSNNPFIGNARYEVVPSEYDFALYDLDQDNRVSVEEFAAVEGISIEEAMTIFSFSDFNKDKYIDTEEFQRGPLVFTVQMAAELSNIAMNGKTAQ